MSNLKDKVVDKLKWARKNKSKGKLSFYQLFLSEIEKLEKDKQKPITDSQINAQAKKWKKNLLETATVAAEAGREGMVEMAAVELEYLSDFLPVYKLKGDTLLKVVHSIVDNLENAKVGLVMKTLATNHKGDYDPLEAKDYAESLIG